MASRSFFQALTRRFKELALLTEDPLSRPISFPRKHNSSRIFSSGAGASDLEDDSVESDDLKSRIFRLRLPKRSVTNVLQRWVSEGNRITVSELRLISKELRKSRRFKHALEVSEWIFAHDQIDLSVSDYAVRIDLISKVFGIDAAERYFDGLPLAVKTSETCTALLHSYAAAKLIERAEKLYEKMKDSSLPFTAIVYNEMMTMYISVGQVEKVSLVVEELRQQKVAPDLFTYNLWISSYAATLNINQVQRILDEMKSDPGCDENWMRYINLANIYITTIHLSNSELNTLVSAGKGISQREWITYDFLIILHTGLGNKDGIDQIWKSLRMTGQKMTSRNYICTLSSYLMFGHLKEAGEVLDQWRGSTVTPFDVSVSRKLLKAFTDIGLMEKARDYHLLLTQKNIDPTDNSK